MPALETGGSFSHPPPKSVDGCCTFDSPGVFTYMRSANGGDSRGGVRPWRRVPSPVRAIEQRPASSGFPPHRRPTGSTRPRTGGVPSGLAHLATSRRHAGARRLASLCAPQSCSQPVAESSPATVGASRPNAGFTGTGGRALRRRESASIVAPGTTRSPDLRGGIRPYDRTSGPRDECKRRQCPSMGVARQDEIRTSARSGPRADNGER